MIKKSNFIKLFLIFLCILSIFLDLYSTFKNKNFLVLESNLIVLNTMSFIVPIFFKFLGLGIIIIALYYSYYLINSEFKKYFYIYIILLFILIQGMAGINNLKIQQLVTDDVNYKMNTTYKVSELPTKEIIKYQVSQEQAKKLYIVNILKYIFPFILGLLSFKLYEWVEFNDRKKTM